MPKETMTSRERWLAALTRQTPDRAPTDYWATPEVDVMMMKHLGCASRKEMLAKMRVDYVLTVKPSYVGPPLAPDADAFGCVYRDVNYGSGTYPECVVHPLAGFGSVEEIERNYTWPSPDWWDYGGIPALAEENKTNPMRGGGSEPLLTYKYMRGDEQAFIDLIENPEIAHYCLGKLFDLAYEDTRRIHEQIPGEVMITYVAEDMGGQSDLMYSPSQIHEFLMPGMKRMMELVHQAGAFAFHHNDGNCRRIIPDMIEAGIDVLNPIQWRCKDMDRERLKRDFGDKLIFHGGVDNQYTIPFGSTEEVRQEVVDNLRILGEGGGYILAPCHNIQPVTPPENVVAMYEACYEEGWTG